MDKVDFFPRLVDRLLKEDKFVITTHRGADPDGLGSELALDFFLRRQGKDSMIFNQEDVPAKFKFLDKEGRVHNIRTEGERWDLSDRMVVFVDNSDIERAGPVAENILEDFSNLVIIDHHDNANPDYYTYFQDPGFGSTAEIIYELFETMDMPMPGHIATGLYTGIVVDTGHFRYNKTRPRTHEIAAKLLERGVNPTQVAEQLLNNAPVDKLLLKKKLYGKIQINAERNMAWFAVQRRDLEELGLGFDDLEGLADELIEPEGIRVGIIFTEREPTLTRASIRSKGESNMIPAVEPFGGGGHKNACGVTFKLDLETAVKEFIPRAAKCVK